MTARRDTAPDTTAPEAPEALVPRQAGAPDEAAHPAPGVALPRQASPPDPQAPPGEPRTGLTPEEDQDLRRLAWLQQFGQVDPKVAERFRTLRARDRRTEIRPPDIAT